MSTSLATIQAHLSRGDVQAAQDALDNLLRSEPFNVDAWRLAVQIAPSPALRANAQSGLQRALAMMQPSQPAVVPAAAPVQPYYVPVPMRYEKDYLSEALITLLLYYLGLGIVGLIVNLVFLSNASRDRAQGIPVRNVGCLQALLAVHLGGLALICGLAAVYVVGMALVILIGAS